MTRQKFPICKKSMMACVIFVDIPYLHPFFPTKQTLQYIIIIKERSYVWNINNIFWYYNV